MADKNSSLLRLVEERAFLRKQMNKEKGKQQGSAVPYIPKDCVSNILVRLPLESLQKSRFVCKPWYNIVSSPKFIDAHLGRAETVLIFLTRLSSETHLTYSTSTSREKPRTFSVESKLFQLQSMHVLQQPIVEPRLQFYLKFMEIKDGKSRIGEFNASCLGNIRTTCNGLILLDNKLKKGGLIVMNPVTRELNTLPPGTLCEHYDESYGLAFNNSNGEYKVVHLFLDELGFVGCEILTLGKRSWKTADGPSFGLFSWFGYDPVSAIGALHWIPHIDHSEYLVSMHMDEDKFHKVPLPKSCRSHDRIVNISGLLCFTTHEDVNKIELWILRNLCSKGWTNYYTITVGIRDMVPLYCTRINGEMIFKDKDGSLYAYHFKCDTMRKVEIKKGCLSGEGLSLPHVNSLVSWKNHEKVHDVDV